MASGKSSPIDHASQAVATAIRVAASATKLATETAQVAAETAKTTTDAVGQTVTPQALRWVEDGTTTIGKLVTPLAENPMVKFFAKVPGISWIMAAIGQVDVEKAQAEVNQLRQQYPGDTPEQLAERIIREISLKAAGIGLMTNFIPPLALTLIAVDLAAVAALQSEMIYRIAAVYGFPLKNSTRRGEVLAIFALARGGSMAVKAGTSIVELIPGLGAVVGATSDAALLYGLGYAACRFYEAKKLQPGASEVVSEIG